VRIKTRSSSRQIIAGAEFAFVGGASGSRSSGRMNMEKKKRIY
jgi:hypothetical protein